MNTDTPISRLAMIARWKPVHLGHQVLLEGLVASAEHVVIGIGSSNRYDVQNPFTAAETSDMLRLALPDATNYSIIEVPDLGHGPRWRAMVAEMLGELDYFVTANAYVRSLLQDVYTVVHPVSFVAPERMVRVDGTMVRDAMATGGDWQTLVPASTAEYLQTNGLVERFRREFGHLCDRLGKSPFIGDA